MDKAQRKKIKLQLLEKELQDYIDKGDEIMANFLRNKLGKKLTSLTVEVIDNTSDSQLIERVYHSIDNRSNWLYKENPRLHKSAQNALSKSVIEHRFVHSFYQFQCLYNTGSVDHFIYDTSKEEIDAFITGLKMLGVKEFVKIFHNRNSDEIYHFYKVNEIKIEKVVIDFIRNNKDQFEIK